MKKQLLFLVLGFQFLTSIVWAAQETMVITDGAMVYRDANFDAPVISYLHVGQKVSISDKKFATGFYRVVLKPGVYGYIADVDVAAGKAQLNSGGGFENPDSGAGTSGSGGGKGTKNSGKSSKAAFSRSMLGVAGGLINYTELIVGQSFTDNLSAFGLKYTAPFGILAGPYVYDLNVLYHPGAPSYYSGLGTRPSSGYLLQADLAILYQFADFASRSGFLYFGAGPLVSLSNFLVDVRGSYQTLQQTNIGASAVAGLGYGIKSFYMKFEARYYFEVTRYLGLQGALQIGF